MMMQTPTPVPSTDRIVGLGLGLPLAIVATLIRGLAWRTPGQLTFAGTLFHDVASILIAVGFSFLIFLWCQSGSGEMLRRALSCVGRTALSNYIGQSVMTSLIATSYGLALFGDLSRLQILLLAVICFAGQLVVSSLWLRVFRIGPLEWVWRCLTYWRWLPVR